MKIVEFQSTPICEIRFLNAGRGPGQFYEDLLPVHVARVDRLPEGTSGIVVTSDLQGRETFQESSGIPPRLLGEVLPEKLVNEILPLAGMHDASSIGAILAGDFYTVPALDKRGGTGDVTDVWQAFQASFGWVAGVAGNHDVFGTAQHPHLRISPNVFYLDGELIDVADLRVAGIGGIIGKPTKPHRRTEAEYLQVLELLLRQSPDVLLAHEGPDGLESGQKGILQIRERLLQSFDGLVIRGHSHWTMPFCEFPTGLQILNVDARVVILSR